MRIPVSGSTTFSKLVTLQEQTQLILNVELVMPQPQTDMRCRVYKGENIVLEQNTSVEKCKFQAGDESGKLEFGQDYVVEVAHTRFKTSTVGFRYTESGQSVRVEVAFDDTASKTWLLMAIVGAAIVIFAFMIFCICSCVKKSEKNRARREQDARDNYIIGASAVNHNESSSINARQVYA